MEFTSSLNCFTTNLWFNSFAWQKREGGRESALPNSPAELQGMSHTK